MAEPSLIPKTGQNQVSPPRESLGTFMVLGVLVFVVAIVALIGLIFYKQFLRGEIAKETETLKKLEAELSRSSIEEWSRTAESIEVAKKVLANHRYLSNVFSFIEKNTLTEVRFSKFTFDAAGDKAKLSAQAKSYVALAQQKEIFEKDPAVKKLGLSEFNLTPKGGVDALVDITFNPSFFGKR